MSLLMIIKRIFFILCFLMSVGMHSQKDIFELARSGSVKEVKALMAINRDTINTIEHSGYSPLILACYRGNVEVAIYLAQHVKDVDGTSKMGTPLMAAVFKDQLVLVEILLEMKADPNIADPNGTTPLHYAIMNRNEALVKLLVDAHADVNVKDNRGNSALDYGHMTQNAVIINLLKKHKI